MRTIIIIAAKEIQEGLRNRWVLATTLLLAALALSLTFLGSAPTGNVGAGRLDADRQRSGGIVQGERERMFERAGGRLERCAVVRALGAFRAQHAHDEERGRGRVGGGDRQRDGREALRGRN